MNFQFAFVSVLILYLIATFFYLMRIIINKKIFSALGLRVTIFTAIVQALILAAHWFFSPQKNAPSYLDYFQLTALSLAVIFIFLCFKKKMYALGPVLVPLVVAFCILSLVYENPYSFTTTGPGFGYLFYHLASIFLSFGAFSLGLISAVAFLLLEKQLKLKKLEGWIAKLPPLSVLEEIHYKSLYVGFILLSLTIVTGAGFSKTATGYYVSGDLKQILSLVCWVFFAILLNFRVSQGWRGKKGVLLSLLGFAALILLFFVGLK